MTPPTTKADDPHDPAATAQAPPANDDTSLARKLPSKSSKLRAPLVFLLAFAALLLLHRSLLGLPYYWDEAGYFTPAARDGLPRAGRETLRLPPRSHAHGDAPRLGARARRPLPPRRARLERARRRRDRRHHRPLPGLLRPKLARTPRHDGGGAHPLGTLPLPAARRDGATGRRDDGTTAGRKEWETGRGRRGRGCA